jgi:hypothetical protein
MDRRIIPMTASRKVWGESRKENSLPAPMNSPHFLGLHREVIWMPAYRDW